MLVHIHLLSILKSLYLSQTKDTELASRFKATAKALAENETAIVNELNNAQGKPVDIGGYYHPDFNKATKAMCPSTTLNSILAEVEKAQLA